MCLPDLQSCPRLQEVRRRKGRSEKEGKGGVRQGRGKKGEEHEDERKKINVNHILMTMMGSGIGR